MNRNLIAAWFPALLTLTIAIFSPAADADEPQKNDGCANLSATDMETLRQKLTVDKKQFVSSNIVLTEDERKAFWPIYDTYQNELEAINSRMANAINNYATAFKDGTAPNSAARDLLDDTIKIEFDEVSLRKKYADKLRKILPDNKVIRYIQIENKARVILRYHLSEAVPLL